MKQKPERIDSIVKSIIEKLDKKSNPSSTDIERVWKEVAGEKISSHTKPASLRKKKLIINVDSSSWLYELTLKKNEFLANLKRGLGEDKIEQLQFRIGEL